MCKSLGSRAVRQPPNGVTRIPQRRGSQNHYQSGPGHHERQTRPTASGLCAFSAKVDQSPAKEALLALLSSTRLSQPSLLTPSSASETCTGQCETRATMAFYSSLKDSWRCLKAVFECLSHVSGLALAVTFSLRRSSQKHDDCLIVLHSSPTWPLVLILLFINGLHVNTCRCTDESVEIPSRPHFFVPSGPLMKASSAQDLTAHGIWSSHSLLDFLR